MFVSSLTLPEGKYQGSDSLFLAYSDGWIITEAQSIYSLKQTIQFLLLPNFMGTMIIILFYRQ